MSLHLDSVTTCLPPVVSHPGECGPRHVHRDHLGLDRDPVHHHLLRAISVVELTGELLVVTRLETKRNKQYRYGLVSENLNIFNLVNIR